MIPRPILFLMLVVFASPSFVLAQVQVLSPSPPQVEYQYQMYYERPWRGWPGPGLSLGGTLPSNSRQGISSFYGVPFAVPLGAGVYMNPFAYSSRLPAVPGAPVNIGLSGSTAPLPPDPRRIEPGVTPISQTTDSNPMGSQGGATPAIAIRQPAVVSSPATIQRSKEMESFGDEQLKAGNWTQAAINYRNAAMTADDRANPHVRLALVSTAMKHYSEGVSEFKRAISLDPMTGKTGETLASIFGPESQVTRKEIVNDVARWAREDFRNQDRLFLLGVVLLFNEDSRSREILQSALNVTGSGDHILALLRPNPIQLPPLESQPVPLNHNAPTPEPPAVNQVPALHKQPLALRYQRTS